MIFRLDFVDLLEQKSKLKDTLEKLASSVDRKQYKTKERNELRRSMKDALDCVKRIDELIKTPIHESVHRN